MARGVFTGVSGVWYAKARVWGGLGFRDLEAFNQALLAKTVWRIAMEPNSLIFRILQAKYFPTTNWAGASAGVGSSLIWKGLMWGRDLLCSGMRWRIGDGNGVRVWVDKWIPIPWSFKVVSPIFSNANLLVKDLMIQQGIWNEQLIKANFLSHEAEAILSIPLAERVRPDIAIWHFCKNGKYSVKSGCWLASELKNVDKGSVGCSVSGSNATASVWEKIWKLNLANKVKVFLWRACHDFLPCAANLFRRHIGNNPTCFRCGREVESTVHCLWGCVFAKKVWKQSLLNGVYKVWKEPSFLTLFEHVASTSSHDELNLFCVIAWMLWKNRNAHKHGEFVEEDSRVIWRAKEWLSAYLSAQTNTHCPSLSSDQNVTDVNWQRPSTSNVKLNTDAACDSKAGRVGIGFVVRDDVGGLVGAGSISIPGNPTVLAVEGLAVFHGMQFCLSEGLKRVEVESDAVNVINALNQNEVNLSMEGCIFDDIKGLIPEFEVVKWRKIPRSCNRVAHSIARRSLSFVEKRFWKEVGPPWLEEGIIADVQI